jgi:parallel beta-helix repeat protein
LEEILKRPKNLAPAGMLLLVVVFLIFGSTVSNASDIYIAQNATGGSNGSDCSDAYAAAWFNTTSNWGSSPGQIGPGTTVHLCGTFNAPAGTSGYLTFQASGNNTSPITLIAEPGATLQSPYWGQGGAINTGGQGYLTLNGQKNGMIQATANGTNLANQAPNCGNNLVCTSGIYASGCSNCTIENWTVANIYVNVPPSDESVAGEGSHGIFMNDANNVTISGNTIHDVRWGISTHFCGDSNWNISGNTIYNIDHGVAMFSDNSNCALTTANIYGNTIHDWSNWDDNNNANHHNAVHVSPTQSGATVTGLNVYNNYTYGDCGQHGNTMTAFIDGQPGTFSNVYIFNNVTVNSVAAHTPADGFINEGTDNSNVYILNNTLIGSSTGNGGGTNLAIQTNDKGSNHATIENNIISTVQYGLVVVPGSNMPSSNYNDFYNNGNIADDPNGNTESTLASWQADCNCDSHSKTGSPAFTGTYNLANSSSAAWNTGINLDGLGNTNLDMDKAGTERPPSSPPNWDMGAYYDSGSVAQSPAPPTGLSALVQ